jgi:hypothetical protein
MRSLQLLALVILGLLAPPALAGQHSSASPAISSGKATGALKVTHDDATTNEHIGCIAYVLDGGNSFDVQCQAVDHTGALAWCESQLPKFVDAIRMINDTTYLTFTWAATDPNHACTKITVENGSQMLP